MLKKVYGNIWFFLKACTEVSDEPAQMPSSAGARVRGYKTVLMHISNEHISTGHKCSTKIKKNEDLSCSYVVFILLINVTMPTIVDI